MASLIKDNEVVLFQGDSITDAGRDRDNPNDLSVRGFVNMTAALFSAAYPGKHVKFINRGLGGNRVKDLRNRWAEDCIDLKPDWVSILIGVNDCWRRYSINDPVTSEAFEEDYRFIIKEAKEKCNANIILCEPFLLPVDEEKELWREDLDPKIHVVRKLAREFNAIYVPFDGLLAQACTKREPEFWAPDGVHPSAPSHAIMAKAWLDATSL